jgi:hypothetical protein
MKKQIVLFVLFLNLFLFSDLFAVWDIYMNSSVPTNKIMRITSIPFEGLNNDSMNQGCNNRYGLILNGFMHRRYFSNTTTFLDSQIVFNSILNNPLLVASCFVESMGYKQAYGFNKYLVTFENINNPNKSISFYWNTLDSKAGARQILGRRYSADWSFNYIDLDSETYVEIRS